MARFVCEACGTQYEDTGEQSPAACAICTDARQYVPPVGQRWTTFEALRGDPKYRTGFQEYEPGLLGIGTTPDFAIGERALLLRLPNGGGNMLWDCFARLDAATQEIVRALGGLRAIAISHPHYYTTMIEWSRAFGDAPIYLHADDRRWVMRPDARAITFWEGETLALPVAEGAGLTLVRCGGHFSGAQVLHWAGGANGAGALLTGDVVNVLPAGIGLSFLYSYPNQIPLSAAAVRRIGEALEPFAYERLYGAWWDRTIRSGGKALLRRTVTQYLAALDGSLL